MTSNVTNGDEGSFDGAAESSLERSLGARFAAAVLGARAATPNLVRRGATFTAAWIVRIGALTYWLQTESGRIVVCRQGTPLMQSSRLTFAASAHAWDAFWRPMPVAGAHDLFALTKRGELQIDGDMHLLLSHLQYLKDVLALPRGEAAQ